MDNYWTSCQVMDDMENFYDNLIIINLYHNLGGNSAQWNVDSKKVDFFSIEDD